MAHLWWVWWWDIVVCIIFKLVLVLTILTNTICILNANNMPSVRLALLNWVIIIPSLNIVLLLLLLGGPVAQRV